jgi:hypothetical protein
MLFHSLFIRPVKMYRTLCFINPVKTGYFTLPEKIMEKGDDESLANNVYLYSDPQKSILIHEKSSLYNHISCLDTISQGAA